ncbi:MAG: enoyl-CoA hydratase/isomerase family protein, partial [Planctomycetota bacterium]
FPPVAAAWWPLLPSSKRVVELLLSGELVDAKSALEAGIVNRVVPDATLQEETEKTLKSLAKSSAVVLAHTKRALSVPLRQIFLKSLEEIERLYLGELMRTHDAEEGLKAFLEKRKPQWRDA